MSRASTLILLGILAVLVPFSGFPIAIRSLFAVILGACVAGIGLSMRAHEARSKQPPPPEIPPASEPIPPRDISPM